MVCFSFLQVLLFLITLIIFSSLFFLKKILSHATSYSLNLLSLFYIPYLVISISEICSSGSIVSFFLLVPTVMTYKSSFMEEHGNPLQYSCLENPMDRGAWQATSPWCGKESDMTEATYHACSIILWACICWNVSVVILAGLG